jgi:uncharacterized protein (TIGR03382 family)
MSETVSLDFGNQLAGKKVRLRFRIATDAASGDFGWQIDDLDFAGIVNHPFSALTADTGLCARAPVARAGVDQMVKAGAAVFLDASASTDDNGDPLGFVWTQVAGPAVTLASTKSALTGFTAPQVSAQTVLTFQVTASDGKLDGTDTIDVVIEGPAANRPPVAHAGPGRRTAAGGAVFLDGTLSTDPDGDPLTFAWTQKSGPSVTLTNASAALAGFTAPGLEAGTELVFELQVSDGRGGMSAALTTVTVEVPPVDQPDQGCSCSAAGRTQTPPTAALLFGLAGAWLLMGRRRWR